MLTDRAKPQPDNEPSSKGWRLLGAVSRTVWVIPLVLAVLLMPRKGLCTSPDTAWYLTQALRMARGYRGVLVEAGGYVRPVLPFLISLSYRVFGVSLYTAFWVVRLFYLGTTMLMVLAGARLFSRWTGLAASLLLLTSATYNAWTGLILIDEVLPFFALLHILLVYHAFEDGRWPWFLAAGLSLAAACATRETAFVFAPLLPVTWLVVSRYRTRRNLGMVLIGMAAFVAIWGVIMTLAVALFYGPESLRGFAQTAAGLVGFLQSFSVRAPSGGTPSGAGSVRGTWEIGKRFGSYYSRFLAPHFVLAPLFPLSWGLALVQGIGKRDRTTRVILVSGLLFSPLMALQSLNNMRVGHLLPFVLLSYLLIAHGAVSATCLLKRRTARLVVGIALIGTLLFLQVFVGVDGRSTLRFAVGLKPSGQVQDAQMGVYGFDFYAGDWEPCHLHALEVQAVGRWIAENLPPQSRCLCAWYLLDSIYLYTGGDYAFSELHPYPTRRPSASRVEVEDDIMVARIAYEPVRETWSDEAAVISIWPPSGRTGPIPLVYAVVEGDFLSQVRAADAEYVIATTANNLLGDYLEAHPGFEEMARFDDVRVRIFQVHDPYALEDYPTYVDLGLIETVVERWDADTATGRELRSFFQDGLGWTEAEMWLALAQSSQRQHHVKEAVPLLERAIAAAPSDPAAYLALGQLYESRGMVEHALTAYERGQTKAGDPELARRAAKVRLTAQPGVPHPQEAVLGSTVRLLGYDLPASTVRPGDDLEITLYWEALETMDASYTMFVHILDEGGAYVSGWDSPPQRGTHPTNGWLRGEIVSDPYVVPLPADAAPGTYTIAVGAYAPQATTRLATANGTTEVTLGTAVQVVTR